MNHYSHIGEILPVRGVIRPVPPGGILFPFDYGFYGVGNGRIFYPLEGYVATLRPGEGRFGGGAVAVEEGTTNLWRNPGWLDGTLSDWNAYSAGGATGEREVVPDGRFGYALRLTKVDSGAGRWGVSQARTWHQTGSVIADSVYVKVVSASNGAMLRCFSDYFNSFDSGGSPYYGRGWVLNLNNTFELYPLEQGTARHLTITPVGDGWYRIEFVTVEGDIVRGSSYYWIDGAPGEVLLAYPQKEAKSFATSFVDGTREAGQLTYDALPNGDFTVSTWFRAIPPLSWFDPAQYMALLQLAEYATSGERHWFEVYKDYFRTRGIGSLAPYDNEWHYLVVVVADGNLRVYFDGEYKGVTPLEFTPRFLRVGHKRDGGDHVNALFDELLILPYAATQEEILSWYHADASMVEPITGTVLGVAL